MRLLPLLVLATALVLAGCAKKNDDGGGTTTTTTTPPTTTTGGSTTPTTPTGTTPTGTTPTTPTDNGTGGGGTTVTPKDLKSGTVTWPTDCSTPGTAGAPVGPCTAVAFTVDPGYTMLNFTVTWSCATPGPCASNGASISAGSLKCDAPASLDPVNAPTAKCTKTGAAASGKITPAPDAAGMVATYKLSES